MRRKTGFIQLIIVAVYFFIFLSGCSLQKIIDIAEGKTSNPRWDIEVDLDVASANLTPDALIFESVDINATLRELGINALFEKVTEDNYPAMKDLGFNKGDYYLKYSLPIEVPEGLFQSDIDTQISDITNNERREYAYGCPVFPIYPLNFYELFHGKKNIGLYRWPIEQEYMTFSVTNNLATYDTSEDQDIVRKVLNVVGLRLPLLPLNASFDMNLKLDFDVNKDNSADINFRGLYLGSESKVSLIVSLYEGTTPRNQYLNEKDIIIEDISVEGKKYNFKYAARTNDSSPLIYESTDFKESVFDLGGDSAKDYAKLNFESIKFTLRGGDSPERNILGPTATPLYVKIIARIDFGKDYSLLCDLYPMTFNLGIAEAPDLGKFTEFIDKNPNVSDPKEKIINTLSSALSLNNVGFVIDMTNDFILPLDITALFDAKTTYNISPSTKEPYDTGVSPPNGGFISYFDLDKDGSYDKFVPLSYPDPKREFIIPQKSAEGPGVQRIVVANNNFNLNEFLEQNDGSNLVRPGKIKAIMTVGTAGEIDSKIHIRNFSLEDPFKINGIFYLPVSLKFMTDKGGLDLAALLPDNTIPLTNDVLKNIPLGDLKGFCVSITGFNSLPVGMDLSFDLVTSDNSKRISLFDNGKIGLSLKENGSLFVNSNGKIDIKAEMTDNLTYTEPNGNKVDYKGSIIDFVKEFAFDDTNKLKMAMNFIFVKTSDDSGEVQSVFFTEESSVSINVNVKGKMSLDFENFK